MASPKMNLTGKLLIAMPGMQDPRFAQSVVLLCSHEADGAMGLIVNKPSPDVRLSDLLGQLDITPNPPASDMTVRYGGPVDGVRGFVLHSGRARETGSVQVGTDFAMTATLDILEDIAAGRGPDNALLMLGYSGWGAGQLDGELEIGSWLPLPLDKSCVFSAEPPEVIWRNAVRSLGGMGEGLSHLPPDVSWN